MRIFVKVFLILLLCLYLSILTKLILFKYIPLTEMISQIRSFEFSYIQHSLRSSNFIPFKTIFYYLFFADINLNIRIDNLIGNIIAFSPLGFILPLLSRKILNLKVITFVSLSLSFAYETFQFIFRVGSFDIDDLILNTFGGILGYLSLKLIQLVFISVKKKYIQKASVRVNE